MKKEIREVDPEKGIVQITTYDERWYTKPSNHPVTGLPDYQFVPSVTWIAGHYPKGVQFYKWLADKGWDEAEAIKQAAGDKGSKIHYAIDDLIHGKEIAMNAQYPSKLTGQLEELSVQEYEAILSFADWYNETKPEIISSEYVVFNDEQGYAGTVDIKCKIDGKTYIVDLKSGQHIWSEYELQLSAYKHAEQGIDALAILQVGYRKNKKKFKFTEIEDKFDLFLAAKQIWANECAGQTPSQKDYPLSVSLSTDTQEPKAPKVAKKSTKKSDASNNISEQVA
jgi:hypothetical protein